MRSADFVILAEGANQGSFFRFDINGRMKAPDLVALKESYLVVAEGKLRGRNLFRRPKARDYSDFDSMAHIAAEEAVQRKLAREAATRLQALGTDLPFRTLRIMPMVFAMNELAQEAELGISKGVTLVELTLNPARLMGVYGKSAEVVTRLLRKD
jgi:hypothetical protein